MEKNTYRLLRKVISELNKGNLYGALAIAPDCYEKAVFAVALSLFKEGVLKEFPWSDFYTFYVTMRKKMQESQSS